jgi:hypothetical protein
MANHAIVEADGIVSNIIVWDGQADIGDAGSTPVPIDGLDPMPGIGWSYNGATFTAPVVPPPPLDQQAQEELNVRQGNGIAITSTGTPALNATYSLDDRSVALVGAIARDAASGLGLPHGAATVPVNDMAGTAHDFTETSIVALYKAERDMVSLLAAQRDVMAGGGTPTWPDQSATIP